MPSGRRAPSLDRAAVRRFWVVVLAALCVVVAAQAGPWQPAQRVAELPPALEPAVPVPEPVEEPPPEPGTEPAERAGPGPDLGWVRRVVVIALAAALLLLLVRWALRRQLPVRPPPPEPVGVLPPVSVPRPAPEPDLDVLQEGARSAEAHLRATATSPADAVIAAWVALERAAARSGVVRERSATATEFTLQVLDRTAADPAAARTLLGLYLRARFDDQPLRPADVESAARAAGALVRTVDHRAAPARHVPPAAGGDA